MAAEAAALVETHILAPLVEVVEVLEIVEVMVVDQSLVVPLVVALLEQTLAVAAEERHRICLELVLGPVRSRFGRSGGGEGENAHTRKNMTGQEAAR